MSVQFGKCNFDGKPVTHEDLERVRSELAPYGPDGEGYLCNANLGILYRAFHTTKESYSEVQPRVADSGVVIAWDGRLDNREELSCRLGGQVSAGSNDLEIVAAAYERWGSDVFSKLIGDWAVSIWDPQRRSLVLARDFVGTRPLYYSFEKDQVTWCSILEPLVLLADRPFALEEEYIAGWLAFLPSPDLTPYTGIHAVPPSCSIHLAKGTQTIKKYWDFSPGKRIRCGSDQEYEEYFRLAFAQSVRRRLRSDSAVTAELSGGMDSSSIVCMADAISGRERRATPLLNTVSFYDDSEPNWNERPYFTKVEQQRGRTGCHIAATAAGLFRPKTEAGPVAVTPHSLERPDEMTKRLAEYLHSQGSRVILSGIGGDEVTGGVPTSTPELSDLLVRGRVRVLARQLKLWALNKRKPWIHLLLDVLRELSPAAFGTRERRLAGWLEPAFQKRHRTALTGYDCGLNLFGPLPSFQENLRALDSLRRQLGCSVLSREPLFEKRYPYLDRDLLEFLYAIPREQILRPGQRRSLMRRALVGIVPNEVLERPRKAYVARAPAATISAEWSGFASATQGMLASSLGIVNETKFREALRRVRDGEDSPIVLVMRTLDIEFWLRNLQSNGRLMRPSTVCGKGQPARSARGALMDAL